MASNSPVKVSSSLSYRESDYDTQNSIDDVGTFTIKGYSVKDIAEVTELDPRTVKKYQKLFFEHLQQVSEEDPYFLEKVQYNTIKALAEFDELAKEAWETVEIATESQMVGSRIQALKLAAEIASKKAQLLQLMGGAKSDGEYIARMQRAETVNQIISKLIRDVSSECDLCRPRISVGLREAFALMNDEGFASPEDAADHLDFDDAEVVEDEIS